MCAPAFLTASAVSKSCSRLSTEQGPAITVKLAAAHLHAADLDDGRLGLELAAGELEGLEDRTTFSTPGSDSSDWSRALPRSSPMAPMTSRSTPWMMWVLYPRPRIFRRTSFRSFFGGALAHDDDHGGTL